MSVVRAVGDIRLTATANIINLVVIAEDKNFNTHYTWKSWHILGVYGDFGHA